MDSIYREQLMEHFKNPQNRGRLSNSQVSVKESNPLCGDTITMQLKVKDGKIEDIKFEGSACAVTVAAASLLTQAVKGNTLAQAKAISKEKLLDLLGVELTTSRIKCAVLPLGALKDLIKKYESQEKSQK